MAHFDFPPVFDFDDPRVKMMLDRITAKDVRVNGNHVSQSKTLQFIAEWYAGTYQGAYDFMRKMHAIINRGGTISHNQAAGVINCLVFDAKRRKPTIDQHMANAVQLVDLSDGPSCDDEIDRQMLLAPTLRAPSKVEDLPADLPSVVLPGMIAKPIACDPESGTPSTLYVRDESITPVIANGTYTVVINESGDYRTLKVEGCPEKFNKPAGTQIASYLSGSDNERDFTGFAFLFGAQVSIWARFKSDSISAQALKILVSAPEDRQRDYGMAYALESGRCYRCGRKLTVPASIHRGLGPDCATKG